MNMTCPGCQARLTIDPTPDGAFWRCTQCEGIAANLAILRKYFAPEVINTFWGRMPSGHTTPRKCPSCSQPQHCVTVNIGGHPLSLDLCRSCQLIWFDRGELDTLPKKRPDHEELSAEATRALALWQVDSQYQLERDIEQGTSKAYGWIDKAHNILMLLLRL